MMLRRLVLLAAISACQGRDTLNASNVLTLTCAGQPTCTAFADGRTTTAVQLCVLGNAPHPAGLSATLVLSHGSWETPTDSAKPTVLTAAIPTTPGTGDADAGATCIDASVVSPTDLSPIYIDASLDGYSQRGCIQMLGPRIDRVVVTTDPTTLTGDQTSITVTATPFGEPGTPPPLAAIVTFKVSSIAPPGALFALQPITVPVDGSGKAIAHLVTSPHTGSVTVGASAEVPNGPPCLTGVADGSGSGSSGDALVPLLPDASVPDAASDAGVPDAAPDGPSPDASGA